MITVRVPVRYRRLIEQGVDRLVRETVALVDDQGWPSRDEDDPEREVVIRIGVERKLVRKPIPRRGESRFPHRRDPELLNWIRLQDCIIGKDCGGVGDRWKIEPCHVVPQGRGSNDRDNTLPMCPRHHDEQEGHTEAFEIRYEVKLAALAREYTAQYERERAA